MPPIREDLSIPVLADLVHASPLVLCPKLLLPFLLCSGRLPRLDIWPSCRVFGDIVGADHPSVFFSVFDLSESVALLLLRSLPLAFATLSRAACRFFSDFEEPPFLLNSAWSMVHVPDFWPIARMSTTACKATWDSSSFPQRYPCALMSFPQPSRPAMPQTLPASRGG